MTFPIALPEWVPSWVPLALMIPLGLYALALIFMPFAVLGVKSRLEAIELRLDEIQGEIRSLALRLPEPLRDTADFDDSYISPPPQQQQRPPRAEPRPEVGPRPPIPPAWQPGEKLAAVERKLASVRRAAEPDHDAGRAEPRLNWPR